MLDVHDHQTWHSIADHPFYASGWDDYWYNGTYPTSGEEIDALRRAVEVFKGAFDRLTVELLATDDGQLSVRILGPEGRTGEFYVMCNMNHQIGYGLVIPGDDWYHIWLRDERELCIAVGRYIVDGAAKDDVSGLSDPHNN